MHKINSHVLVEIAIVCGLIGILCFPAPRSFGQKKTWQAGTVLEVKAHHGETDGDSEANKYDISVKVGKKIYVVLYMQGKDRAEPEYYVGMATTVLIEGDTLKFNDLQGRTHSVRILSSKDAPGPESK